MRKIRKKEKSQELISLFQKFDSHRKQYEEKAIQNYKLFIGHRDEREDGRSNLHIPRTYEVIDTLRSRFLKAFFDQRPYLDFIPQPEGGSTESLSLAEDKAEIAAALVDMQLDKNNAVELFYDYITSFLIFPAAIVGVGWRWEQEIIKKRVPQPIYANTPFGQRIVDWKYQTVKQWETTWDDNEIVNIDFFDFWIDPAATNLDDARGVFQREWLTREELENKIELLSNAGEGELYPVDLDSLANDRVDQGRFERISSIGKSQGEQNIYNSPEKDSFEVLHYWEDRRHAIIINRTECIYDGPSPYWRHRKKPFVVESYDPLPNEFYGLSAVDIIADLQEEENTQHNQRMDSVNMVINKMWKVRRGADIDDDQLISRPHGIVEVDNMDDVMTFEMGDIPASAFQAEQKTIKQIENAIGTPPIVRGAEGTRGKTATETREQSSSAAIRFDTKIMLFESIGMKRLAHLMDMNNQQFVDDERLVKVSKESNQSTWQKVSPAEIMGQFDYRPAGANIDPSANKEIRREQLTNMMMFLMEQGNPFVDYQKLTREWIQAFDIRNPEKFLLSEEEMMQQMAQNQQQEQEEGQGQPQGPTQQPSPTQGLGVDM